MSEDFSTQASIDKTITKRTGYTIVALFSAVGPAQQALHDLRDAHFDPNNISFVTRDREVEHKMQQNEGTQPLDKADASLVGSLGGGTLGAALGWLAAGGALIIPGIGPVLAAGALAGVLGGALIGGSIGGIAGALVGSGLPQTEASEYEEQVRGGQSVITVYAPDSQMLQNAGNIFLRQGATNLRYYDLSKPNVGPGIPFTDNNNNGYDQTQPPPTQPGLPA